MELFLKNVVKKVLLIDPDLSHLLFVLPNQRSGVYLRKYLKEQLKKTAFFPEIITFDSFAEQIAGIQKTPAIELLFEFYTVYKKCTPKEDLENFETFTNWAKIVLDDFNQIDAYLVDSNSILGTLKDINQLHKWDPSTEMSKKYLNFLSKLNEYYNLFYQTLLAEQKGYQGLILREAEKIISYFISSNEKKIIFAGFNHLKKSESQIIQELLAAGKAAIYWDISENMLKKNHLSGMFIKAYKEDWTYYKTNSLTWIDRDNFNYKNIEIVGVSKNVGMMKYASEIVMNTPQDSEVALIVADQTSLPVVLNSLPNTIDKVNITMGMPLHTFPFLDLVKSIFDLHTETTASHAVYYHKNVFRILKHPVLLSYIQKFSLLSDQLLLQNKVRISYEDIKKYSQHLNKQEQSIVSHIFESLPTPNTILLRINSLIDYLKNYMEGYEKEVLYKCYNLNNQLYSLTNKYSYLPTGNTLRGLYNQLLYSEHLNFLGEPLEGFQVMGFLESQALDFKKLIITSLNEGILPKGKRRNSFIPFDVRKHYQLPTYKEEDAISAYHFYRLIQRAEEVTLLYNTQVDTFGGGEKSRFLTALLWEYPKIKQKQINSIVPSKSVDIQQLVKTKSIIRKLEEIAEKGFSPSALTSYLYNPILFYKQRVLGIYEFDKIEETIADNTMGTVIHNTLEQLYKDFVGKVLNVKDLANKLPEIRSQVEKCFTEVYKNGQFVQGKNKLIFEVIINYVKRFIKQEIEVVKSGKIIRIVALEKSLEQKINFPKFDFPITIKGVVDRIDTINGVFRIIDYKSGKVETTHLRIDRFEKLLEDYKYSKALQVLLYSYLCSKEKTIDFSGEMQAGIISFKNLKAGFIPVNFAPMRTKQDFVVTTERIDDFLAIIQELLIEIFDENIPFVENN